MVYLGNDQIQTCFSPASLWHHLPSGRCPVTTSGIPPSCIADRWWFKNASMCDQVQSSDFKNVNMSSMEQLLKHCASGYSHSPVKEGGECLAITSKKSSGQDSIGITWIILGLLCFVYLCLYSRMNASTFINKSLLLLERKAKAFWPRDSVTKI